MLSKRVRWRAPAGGNGAVVLFLTPHPGLFMYSLPRQASAGQFRCPHDPPPRRTAKGIATASDFIGLLEGMAMSDLVDAIDAGNIHVNVHTPFSLPGEIRGQLSQVGDLPSRKRKAAKK